MKVHESSAEVAYFEEEHARLLSEGVSALYLPWDDHSKIEPGKKRGFAGRRCVQHKRRVATAPYSDMGVKLGVLSGENLRACLPACFSDPKIVNGYCHRTNL